MSRDEILELRHYLNKNLSKDFIQVSCFQMIISVLFIKKFEEELYFCMNYRDLNAITVKNQYSLSLISETLNCLNRAKIFIKLNIISAFNQLRIKEEDEALIIFHTWFELFEYLVMLFNLCNESVSSHQFSSRFSFHLRFFLVSSCFFLLSHRSSILKREATVMMSDHQLDLEHKSSIS
jgi:hypothetical protein